MAARTVTLRCPRCGRYLSAPTPFSTAAAWYACPHCGAPVPVVAPRLPAPLFSWEVYPHLYPPLPPPRGPSARVPAVAFALLAALAIVLSGLAGVFAYAGATSLSLPAYSVGGTVRTDRGVPIAGATVNISGEDGFDRVVTTGSSGAFALSGVPGGGVLLNASALGFSSESMSIFLSPVYSATGGSAAALDFALSPGPSNLSASEILSAFPNLENFLTSLFSGALWLGIAALLCALGARSVRRTGGSPLGVSGGFSAILAPFGFLLLGVSSVFPYLVLVGSGLIGVGVLVTTLLVLPMLLAGPAPDA